MFKSKKILAIIGARKGSKGLPNKNRINFLGYPLIMWTIQAARGTAYVDRIIVSTDCERIKKISENTGADVPFLRPKQLSQDNSNINNVITHCLSWLRKNEKAVYDYILLLQPTSPFRTHGHIDDAIEFYFKKKLSKEDTLISVRPVSQKMGYLMKVKGDNYIERCLSFNKNVVNRQDLGRYFLPNGAIFFAPVPTFLKQKTFYTSKTLFFPMTEIASIDIDSMADLKRALKFHKDKKSYLCGDV